MLYKCMLSTINTRVEHTENSMEITTGIKYNIHSSNNNRREDSRGFLGNFPTSVSSNINKHSIQGLSDGQH